MIVGAWVGDGVGVVTDSGGAGSAQAAATSSNITEINRTAVMRCGFRLSMAVVLLLGVEKRLHACSKEHVVAASTVAIPVAESTITGGDSSQVYS
jgi:Na+/serine symporter